jgi:FixJ family two-component response regulator
MKLPLISIIDDDDMVRAATEGLIQSLGFETRTFSSAESFMQSSSLLESACLILDVQLPKMNGIELQEQLHRLGLDIPIIFITAYPDETAETRALDAGAVGYLYKHDLFRFEQRLVDCLKAALDRSEGRSPDGA